MSGLIAEFMFLFFFLVPIAIVLLLSQVDASVLHYKNQQLVQQLDLQKQELNELEARIKALKEKQASYDNSLIKVNRLWNQVVYASYSC